MGASMKLEPAGLFTAILVSQLAISASPIQGLQAQAHLTEVVRIDGHVEALTPIALTGDPSARVAVGNGHVYVLQRQDAGIAVFDTLGARVGFLGGRGEGPGEFSNIVRVEVLPGGDVWARDSRLNRATWFRSGDPSDPHTERLPAKVSVPGSAGLGIRSFSFPAVEYPLSEALAIANLRQSVSEADALPDSVRHAVFMGVVRFDGSLNRMLAVAPGEPPSLRRSDGSVVSLPFVPRPEADIAPDGASIAWAYGWVDGERAGQIEVRVISTNGEERFRTTLMAPLREVPETEKEGWGDVPFPQNLPLTDALVLGHDGTVWVGHTAHSGQRRFSVLTSSGAVIGDVVLPTSQKLAAASRDWVWVLHSDEFDVESVVKYSVSW